MIPTEFNSYRVAVKCQEKSASKSLVIMANLALKNQKIWSGFLWYLAAPSGQYYVHKPSIVHPPKTFNTARRKLAFLLGKPNAHFIGSLLFRGLSIF